METHKKVFIQYETLTFLHSFLPESLGRTSTLQASLVVSEIVEPYGSSRTGKQSMLPNMCSAAAPVESAQVKTHGCEGAVSDLKQQVGGLHQEWQKVNRSPLLPITDAL